MKYYLAIALLLTSLFKLSAQSIDVDLSQKSGISLNLEIETKTVRLLNMSKDKVYQLDWKKEIVKAPVLDIAALASNDGKLSGCNSEVKQLISDLDSEGDEVKVKDLVNKGREMLSKLDGDCAAILKESIGETERVEKFPFVLGYNQVITLKITRTDKGGANSSEWTYKFKTPEKSRWLVHYGLTYAPSIISKVDHYHAFADTSVANKYTITKNNDNGPKAWDNVSATINFTYPFHADSRGLDGGFTAGFGLSTGFELSGRAGLSLIIGENIILGTGLGIMQKQKLKGEYGEGQIIKENLSFDALHEKVWLPEVFFTVGFRFGSNPFAKKTESDTAKKPADN